MRRDVFVYLSGPMSAKHGYSVEQNCAEAVAVYLALLQHGIPGFCPQLSGIWPSAWTALPHAEWLQYDYAVIDRCTHVLMLPRWNTSTGALHEHAYAQDKGIPILYRADALIAHLAAAAVGV